MGKTISVLGALVLLIGVIGLVQWIYVYTQASSPLSGLAGIEENVRGVESIGKSISWIPFIGQIGGTAGEMAGYTADTINSIRTMITVYILSNMLMNGGLVLTGIALINIGNRTDKITTAVKKTRLYLKKQKDKKK